MFILVPALFAGAIWLIVSPFVWLWEKHKRKVENNRRNNVQSSTYTQSAQIDESILNADYKSADNLAFYKLILRMFESYMKVAAASCREATDSNNGRRDNKIEYPDRFNDIVLLEFYAYLIVLMGIIAVKLPEKIQDVVATILWENVKENFPFPNKSTFTNIEIFLNDRRKRYVDVITRKYIPVGSCFQNVNHADIQNHNPHFLLFSDYILYAFCSNSLATTEEISIRQSIDIRGYDLVNHVIVSSAFHVRSFITAAEISVNNYLAKQEKR